MLSQCKIETDYYKYRIRYVGLCERLIMQKSVLLFNKVHVFILCESINCCILSSLFTIINIYNDVKVKNNSSVKLQ